MDKTSKWINGTGHLFSNVHMHLCIFVKCVCSNAMWLDWVYIFSFGHYILFKHHSNPLNKELKLNLSKWKLNKCGSHSHFIKLLGTFQIECLSIVFDQKKIMDSWSFFYIFFSLSQKLLENALYVTHTIENTKAKLSATNENEYL